MWKRLPQLQQRGVQMPARDKTSRPAGEAPDEATRDREAQDHDRADLDLAGEMAPAGGYPASPIEHRRGDNTPTAPDDGRVEWDDVVQPPQRGEASERDDPPRPEGQ